MKFTLVSSWNRIRVPKKAGWSAWLQTDNWDDFDFKTSFLVCLVDPERVRHELGTVKIGQVGMQSGIPIADHPLPDEFEELDESFFSVGQSDKYYSNLKSHGDVVRTEFLQGIRDIAFDLSIVNKIQAQNVFRSSLMRSIHVNTLKSQYHRLAHGNARLESFSFAYTYPTDPPLNIDFSVVPESEPPTNVHVLIGRNGVGKTRLLRRLADVVRFPDLMNESNETFGFVHSQDGTASFWNLVTVAFSAFDSFNEHANLELSPSDVKYHYFGLKMAVSGDEEAEVEEEEDEEEGEGEELEGDEGSDTEDSVTATYVHKSTSDIVDEFHDLLRRIVRSKKDKAELFADAVGILSSDPIIGASLLRKEFDPNEFLISPKIDLVVDEFRGMSSGHKIVVFTLAGLVHCVDEKTLVLIDEPETHLHPPLLAAFIRAISSLLIERNGVAIIATHSPVVLQEVPRSCVWKLSRQGEVSKVERPGTETFGENVGTLTREVFGLEVTRSGFFQMLVDLVEKHESYEEVIDTLHDQLGSEGKAMIRVLFSEKESK